jgi:hypothetical protein
MTAVRFQLEIAFEAGGRGYVIARLLDPEASFDVGPGASLGGCLVESWLDAPLALDADGKQRRDLFGFCLMEVGDLSRLSPGDFVELVG